MQQQQIEEEACCRPELSKADVEEMSEWFYFFDKNNDNRLDRDELRRVFHAMCWSVSNDEMEYIFNRADKDKSGFIEYDEYMDILTWLRKDRHVEKCELMEAFRYFDKDRSGFIDAKELRRFLMTLGEVFCDRDRRELEELIIKNDVNGDGKIDIEEFVNIILERPPAPSAKY